MVKLPVFCVRVRNPERGTQNLESTQVQYPRIPVRIPATKRLLWLPEIEAHRANTPRWRTVEKAVGNSDRSTGARSTPRNG